jgi:UDP-2-acetamido-3-amino-2,3-dideoxy-glucuronate N-acetyltransferase
MAEVYVHPNGLCESLEVGSGTRVWAFAHVMAGARIGRDCNIGGGCFVETGAVIGDRCVIKNGVQVWDGVTLADEVFVGPNATFTNDLRPRAAGRARAFVPVPTRVEVGASIGANATIVCGIVIGAHAMIAAGTVVARDVPSHALMLGAPARRIGWVCTCGETLDAELACGCGRRYRCGDERDGLAAAR